MNPPGDVAPAAWLRDRRAALLLLAVGFAVLLPEFFTGPSTSDSLRYNVVWLDQWRELVAGGNLYPRWMPRAWDGLGSPAFIFYPPLFFWIAVALDQLTLRLLETGTLISLTSAILLGASGLTMRHWLRAHVGAGAALLGGLAYMLAPYHIHDIFARAALAETCAYAVLPLVMLSMKRAGEGDALAFPALAAAYAALILSHLPIALLTSIVLLPAYALSLTTRPAMLVRLVGAGLLGAGLAAIYLVPALSSTDTILAEALSTSFFRPENWFFWQRGILAHPVIWIVLPTCIAAALFSLSSLQASRQSSNHAQVRFWAVLSIAIVLLVAGFPPAFWSLPAVMLVQFPWRLMLLLEFTAITVVALVLPRASNPLFRVAAVPLIVAFGLSGALSAQRLDASWERSAADMATIRASYRDAPEYLPAGYVLPLGPDGIPNPALVTYPQRPAIGAGRGAHASATKLRDGGMVVAVMAPSPTTVIARRFGHGPWEVRDGRGRSVPTSRTADHLVSWKAPAGRSLFHLRLGTPVAVIASEIVSGLSLFVLLLLFVRAKRARQHRDRSLEIPQ